MNRSRRLVATCGLLLSAAGFAADDAPMPTTLAAEPTSASDADRPVGSHCLRETGSRIAPEPGKCLSVPGRVITRGEIERTGASTAAEALRDLRP